MSGLVVDWGSIGAVLELEGAYCCQCNAQHVVELLSKDQGNICVHSSLVLRRCNNITIKGSDDTVSFVCANYTVIEETVTDCCNLFPNDG